LAASSPLRLTLLTVLQNCWFEPKFWDLGLLSSSVLNVGLFAVWLWLLCYIYSKFFAYLYFWILKMQSSSESILNRQGRKQVGDYWVSHIDPMGLQTNGGWHLPRGNSWISLLFEYFVYIFNLRWRVEAL